jgi:hypothetical protein
VKILSLKKIMRKKSRKSGYKPYNYGEDIFGNNFGQEKINWDDFVFGFPNLFGSILLKFFQYH